VGQNNLCSLETGLRSNPHFQREGKMGIFKRFMLTSITALGLAVASGMASAQSPSVNIETEYLMTLEGTLEPGQPVGQRVIVNVPGGSAHGPKINGTLIPPTGDWLILMADGSTVRFT
jgi:hypothetical protein